MSEWRKLRHGDEGKYAFLSHLPDDAPPSLLRSFRPLKWSTLIDAYEVDNNAEYRWQYWTVGGWADVQGMVCVCERPEIEP